MTTRPLPLNDFVVVDLTGHRVLYEKNADQHMPTSSMSKMMTIYMVFDALKKGKVKLDDRVQDYLPWFTPPTSHDDAAPITLRHILTHTTGLAREAPFPYWTELSFPAIEEIRGKKSESK